MLTGVLHLGVPYMYTDGTTYHVVAHRSGGTLYTCTMLRTEGKELVEVRYSVWTIVRAGSTDSMVCTIGVRYLGPKE